jgi:hypothetical protein
LARTNLFGESTASSKNLETGICVKFRMSLTMGHILNKQENLRTGKNSINKIANIN